MMKIFLFMCFFLVFCSQSFAAKPPVKNPLFSLLRLKLV